MQRFNFKKVLNPVEEIFVAHNREGMDPITFRLAPIDTASAFDAARWQAMMAAQRVNDANEMQFQMGVNRVTGWNDVLDEDGNEADFAKCFGAFTRLLDGIGYLMAVGKKTLQDLEAIPMEREAGNGLGANGQMTVSARVIPGEPTAPETPAEASESNSETPSA